jgi:hypothetical protein
VSSARMWKYGLNKPPSLFCSMQSSLNCIWPQAKGVTNVTEDQWLTCTDQMPMLEFLRGKVSGRKLRLFAVACCRRVSHMLTTEAREAVELAERVAEGLADSTERKKGRDKALHAGWVMDDAFRHRRGPAKAAVCDALCRQPYQAATGSARRTKSSVQDQCHLLRDIIPNPFIPVSLNPAWLAWNDGIVIGLTEAAYAERAVPGGTLDEARLAVLADALEEAGCDTQEILEHLRGPGPHA